MSYSSRKSGSKVVRAIKSNIIYQSIDDGLDLDEVPNYIEVEEKPYVEEEPSYWFRNNYDEEMPDEKSQRLREKEAWEFVQQHGKKVCRFGHSYMIHHHDREMEGQWDVFNMEFERLKVLAVELGVELDPLEIHAQVAGLHDISF